jgi:hypothetical protein
MNRRVAASLALVPFAVAPIAWASASSEGGNHGRALPATESLTLER